MAEDEGGDDGDAPLREPERDLPGEPLVTGEGLRKAGIALVGAVFLALVIVVTIFLLRIAKFPWLA